MKHAGIVVGVLVAATASAAPGKRVTWGDWVGAYQGKLAWSQCAVAGAKQATLALSATDGVMSIDLTPASAGLRAMTLVEDERGFSGQQGDVKVAIKRPKANAITVEVQLDSGCSMKAQLARAGARSNVAACDQLTAWAHVEAACSKQRDKLEDVAKLVATKWRPADAGRCASRVSRLELALVDAGCAPHPDPLIGVRARDCIELSQVTAKLARCGHVPAAVVDPIRAEAAALSAASQSAEKATLPYVEQQCRDARSNVTAIATRFQCAL
jgi:hypothetical protein